MTDYRQAALKYWDDMQQALNKEHAEQAEFYQKLWDSAHPPGFECKFCTGELDPFEDSND